MTITTIDGRTELRPAEGKYLTNGVAYSELVYLGISDSSDNWTEVDSLPPVDDDEDATEQDYLDALAELGVSDA